VLLTGESGTGKELFARALHELSPRRAGPFVALNCAAIPDGLLETELFGHEKGAFTGASQRTLGRFEQAAGGTLFLDEIGELALPVQAKILRVLEERRFERVGGRSSLVADVRLVAATNQSLERMVEQGRFRGDLFFRLDVFPIALPPLRERPSDIPLLAQHLLHRISSRLGGAAKVLEPEALELLAQESWPGNVRQLGNVLERAAILSEGNRVGVDELRGILAPSLERGERERLVAALTSAAGDKHRAAEALGWPYRKVLQKVKEHDLEGVPLYRSG
jgi:transcriptional regulator with GAF, ATPase, and Fis domain